MLGQMVFCLFFRNTLIFRSPRRRRERKTFCELIDKIFRGAVSHHIGNVQNFHIRVHQKEGRTVNFLFIEEIDNRLIEVFCELSANVPVAIWQFCRQIFHRIKEIFGIFQFLYKIIQPHRAGGRQFC